MDLVARQESTRAGLALHPDRYERSGWHEKLVQSRRFSSRPCMFVRVRSRGFCGRCSRDRHRTSGLPVGHL